jgi:RimJ/RimL family protein N-acetyltransferase
MFVAKVAGNIVGYGRVSKRAENAIGPGMPGGYYLTGLLVDPAWRRRGIANALTRARLRWVFQRSNEVFYITDSTNEASLLQHATLGFQEVRRVPGTDFTDGEAILVRLDVQDAYPDVQPSGMKNERTLVPDDFEVPAGLTTADFRLEPLGPEHNVLDYAAWTSSIEHIQATPGFLGRAWPGRVMTLDENLADLERHARDFAERRGFTYTVLAGDEVIGCVYIYPARRAGYDADVRSWVRASHAHLDGPLYRAVSAWLASAWPFASVDYAMRQEVQ